MHRFDTLSIGRNRVVYICNNFDGFIYHTVLKIEELPWRVVASTVETLVSRFVGILDN